MEFPSKRLIAAYVFDWLVIVAIAAIGAGLNFVSSKQRPFSLVDLSISYPFVPESISIVTVGLVGLLAPAAIIVIVVIVAVPSPAGWRANSLTRVQLIRRKLWECHVGLAGLALSVALGFLVTQGLKNIVGKPRPHLLALCKPDVGKTANYFVGGYGQDISERWTLVDAGICTQGGPMLNDAFRSFPSGHSSFSWSGLLYLSLFLCAKFRIVLPHPSLIDNCTQRSEDTELLPLHNSPTNKDAPGSNAGLSDQATVPLTSGKASSSLMPLYNRAAGAPLYGIVIVLVPLAVASYITTTRYNEYWHFGFDVLSGAFIGILSALLSFFWYQAPLGKGEGWAWGPRSRKRAFWIGAGLPGYVGGEGWSST